MLWAPLFASSPLRFFLGSWHQSGFLAENRPTRTLREILTRLRETYCGSIGYEVRGRSEGGASMLGGGNVAGLNGLAVNVPVCFKASPSRP